MLNQSEGEKAESWLKNYFQEINASPFHVNSSKLKRLAFSYHRSKTITALEKNPDAEQNSSFYLDKIFKVDVPIIIDNRAIAIDITVNREPQAVNKKLQEIKSDRLENSIKELGFDSHVVLVLPDTEAQRNRLISEDKMTIIKGIGEAIAAKKSLIIMQAPPAKSLGAKLANQVSQIPNLLQILPILQRNNIIIREKLNSDRPNLEIYQTPKPHEKTLKVPIKSLKLMKHNNEWLKDNTPPPRGMIQMPDRDIRNIVNNLSRSCEGIL